MNATLPWLISLRFKRRHHYSNILSLISIISNIGIALGVSVLIIVLSIMNGFEYELSNRVLAIVPHGIIEPVHQPWCWMHALHKIVQVQGVVTAAPYINFIGIIEKSTHVLATQIQGMDLEQEGKLGILPKFIQHCTWTEFKSGRQQIIIGKGIADTLQVKPKDWIYIMIPPNTNNHYKLQQSKFIQLQIAGILEFNGQLDHSFAMVPIEDARIYSGIKHNITGIAIRFNNIFNAKQLIQNIIKVIDSDIYAKTWIEDYGYIYQDIQMIRSIMYLSMILVISIACFNIVSILMLTIKDKKHDIAILRTLGANNNFIRSIFIWYSLVLGLIGSSYGTIIGIVISLQLTPIIHIIEYLIGHQILSSKIYFINFLPSKLHFTDIIYVITTTIVLSLLTGWYPAYRANRIDPVRVLNRR